MEAISSIFLILTGLGLLFATIALPFWAYGDAEARGKDGCLVALLVFFVSFPVGLIIWLVIRPQHTVEYGYDDRHEYSTPKPLERNYYSGKDLRESITKNHWLLTDGRIDETEFNLRKRKFIEDLKKVIISETPNDFIGELVPLIKEEIITKEDIEKIEYIVSGEYKKDILNKKRVVNIIDRNDTELIMHYFRTRDHESTEELKSRFTDISDEMLLAKLDNFRVIDLYRELRLEKIAAELKRRGLENFL